MCGKPDNSHALQILLITGLTNARCLHTSEREGGREGEREREREITQNDQPIIFTCFWGQDS